MERVDRRPNPAKTAVVDRARADPAEERETEGAEVKVAVRLDRWVGAVSPDRPGPVARWDWAAAPAGAVERPGRQAAVGRRDRAAAPAAEARADLPAVAAPAARRLA